MRSLVQLHFDSPVLTLALVGFELIIAQFCQRWRKVIIIMRRRRERKEEEDKREEEEEGRRRKRGGRGRGEEEEEKTHSILSNRTRHIHYSVPSVN